MISSKEPLIDFSGTSRGEDDKVALDCSSWLAPAINNVSLYGGKKGPKSPVHDLTLFDVRQGQLRSYWLDASIPPTAAPNLYTTNETFRDPNEGP